MWTKCRGYTGETAGGHYPVYEQYWSLYYFNAFTTGTLATQGPGGPSDKQTYTVLRSSFPAIIDDIGGVFV